MRARRATPDRVVFWCPGCDSAHMISDAPGRWTFNGDFDRPTFSPSVLVTTGHHVPDFGSRNRNSCWCTYDAEHSGEPSGFKCARCHSFVRDGQIQFLGDSTHALAGRTVDIPDWREVES